MVNFNMQVQYQGPQNFQDVMTEINAHLPSVAYSRGITHKSGCKVQDLITYAEKHTGSTKSQIDSLKRKIEKVEYDSSHPTCGTMVARIGKTAALVLAYIVLAATIFGLILVIPLIEIECDAFARASKGYSPKQLGNDKSRLNSLSYQLKTGEESLVGLNELKAKAPAVMQTLEQRIALLKQTEADILANASTNHIWHTLVGQNSRTLYLYESALLWFKQAVIAA